MSELSSKKHNKPYLNLIPSLSQSPPKTTNSRSNSRTQHRLILSSAPPSLATSTKLTIFKLYLASLGLDPFPIILRHPPLASCSISHLKSTLQFLSSFNFTPPELRKIFDLNPEILTAKTDDIAAVVNFLIREVSVLNSLLKTVLIRAPRLMSCGVLNRLRPTMAFLNSIGVSDLSRHPSLMSLLSYSVEDKLVPCIRYLEMVGFEFRDVVFMVRKFPQLLRCDIEDNLEPKLQYLVNEMETERRELRDFPQYFAFSLENRIKRRHRICVEKSVRFPLGIMLKIS